MAKSGQRISYSTRARTSNSLEADVARTVDAYLGTLGLRVFRADQGGGRFRRRTVGVGLPDRWGYLPNGRGFMIELKRPGAYRRANEAKQNEVLDWARANGVLVIVATCVEDVQRELNVNVIAVSRIVWNQRPAVSINDFSRGYQSDDGPKP